NYVAELFKIYLEPEKRKMYSSSLIQIPAPEFYVFYDGDDTSFERKILKLSDAFKAPSDKLELIVHVYNLATGKNEALKSICKPLREYSTFSNHYKLLRQQGLAIDEAVRDTIRYCIDNNVMRDYLQCNESEVINMFGFEWNEKEEREALLEAGEARGITIGEARERIDSARTLLTQGIVTLQALQSSGYYSQEELAAIAKPL
ncbi:MAG: hypothetical protein II310_09590, partial [Selenomonadaceae bacterium]|nr:hypothetical protein [Selenomonadaceae bacterium]